MRILSKGAIQIAVGLAVLLGIVSAVFANTPMPQMTISSPCSDGYCLTTNNCSLLVEMQVTMAPQPQRSLFVVSAPLGVESLPTILIKPPETST